MKKRIWGGMRQFEFCKYLFLDPFVYMVGFHGFALNVEGASKCPVMCWLHSRFGEFFVDLWVQNWQVLSDWI
jgi:hypothetical protein